MERITWRRLKVIPILSGNFNISCSVFQAFSKVSKQPRQYLLVQSQKWKHQNKFQCLFIVNNRGTRTMSMIHFGVFIVSFEHISHLF